MRLADDADRHIGLGEPRQRFLDMPRGLILGHHGLETVDRGGVVAVFHVVAADRHFILRLLVGHFLVALALMQSAFLDLFDDLLLAHRFGPFTAPLFEVTCCFY